MWQVCENKRAATFLAAFKFNEDEVYTQCIFYQTVGDIYAADILYHTNCMSSYLLKFERDMARINEICNDLDKRILSFFSNITKNVFSVFYAESSKIASV